LDVKVTATYDLPLGKGKRFLNSGGLVNTLFGGWQLVMYVERASGRAMSVTTSNNLSNFGYSVKRANVDSSKPLTLNTSSGDFNPAKDRYLNAAAFASPATYALGNTPRTMDWLRGWPLASEAASVSKTISIRERASVKIGADFNNPFNLVRWGNPVTNVTAPNFGAVTSSGAGRQIQLTAEIKF
jgi:hypothetical protein